MRPNSEHTTPDQRFFYLDSGFGEMEYHESLEAADLPSVMHIGGADSYVVVRTAENETEAHRLTAGSGRLPVGANILQVRGTPGRTADQLAPPSFMVAHEIARHLTSDEGAYDPQIDSAALAIIQLDRNTIRRNLVPPQFSDKGITLLPANEPLPDIPENYLYQREVPAQYSLLGFISPDDRLATWNGPTGFNSLLVDWCVASALNENALEAILLSDALPGAHLDALLSAYPAALAYLRYYDAKHDTQFAAAEDPRHQDTSRFSGLTDEQRSRYVALSALARQLG